MLAISAVADAISVTAVATIVISSCWVRMRLLA
ncbi:Uncharacterised protein [Vibrio cholerae]|nr:Uncharacterised protein [Vibrio cholerae]